MRDGWTDLISVSASVCVACTHVTRASLCISQTYDAVHVDLFVVVFFFFLIFSPSPRRMHTRLFVLFTGLPSSVFYGPLCCECRELLNKLSGCFGMFHKKRQTEKLRTNLSSDFGKLVPRFCCAFLVPFLHFLQRFSKAMG